MFVCFVVVVVCLFVVVVIGLFFFGLISASHAKQESGNATLQVLSCCKVFDSHSSSPLELVTRSYLLPAWTLLAREHGAERRGLTYAEQCFLIEPCLTGGLEDRGTVRLGLVVVVVVVVAFLSQQHARASQGRIYSDNCYTEIEVTDRTFRLTQYILTPGQQIPALSLQHQAPGRVATGVSSLEVTGTT